MFGALKFVPGLSLAEDLSVATIDRLTLGIVSGSAALVLTAVTETVIGLTLVTGRFVRVGLVVLAGALVGIMSPLVLFYDDMPTGARPWSRSTCSRTSCSRPPGSSSPPTRSAGGCAPTVSPDRTTHRAGAHRAPARCTSACTRRGRTGTPAAPPAPETETRPR